jgi:DNA-binding LacI/PurR family transcriptional regulator
MDHEDNGPNHEHNGLNGHRPTLQRVAERAGVSKSLVSLVMRGEPMVREEKRQRVLQAAEELGYQARGRTHARVDERSTSTVGVLVADLRNPFLVDVVEQAASVLEDAGLTPVLTTLASPTRSSSHPRLAVRAVDVLKDLRVRALLIVGSVSQRAAFADLTSGIPVVVTAAHAEGLHADVVRNDDRLGMRLVIDYLVASGHRAIAHLGGLGGGTAQERLAGYCDAMHHHGLTSEIATAEADFTEDSGYRATAQLLRRGPRVTAITAVNDLAAVGALSAAADAGLRIPRDLAVTGYDDTFLAAIRQVSLTSVNPDSAGMGALAARCLLRRIDTPGRDTEQHLLPPRLVTRFSSNAPS